jgi:hypothetical protein
MDAFLRWRYRIWVESTWDGAGSRVGYVVPFRMITDARKCSVTATSPQLPDQVLRSPHERPMERFRPPFLELIPFIPALFGENERSPVAIVVV